MLAEDFQQVVDSLPPDWTYLEVDLRISDQDRYVETATLLTQINAMPYSKAEWQWLLRVANDFGHAAAADTDAASAETTAAAALILPLNSLGAFIRHRISRTRRARLMHPQ